MLDAYGVKLSTSPSFELCIFYYVFRFYSIYGIVSYIALLYSKFFGMLKILSVCYVYFILQLYFCCDVMKLLTYEFKFMLYC
jgi:hypothetical protein